MLNRRHSSFSGPQSLVSEQHETERLNTVGQQVLYVTQGVSTPPAVFQVKHQIYGHRKNERKGKPEVESMLPVNRVNRTDCFWDKREMGERRQGGQGKGLE